MKQQKGIPVITGSFINGELFKMLPRNEMPKQLWQENQYLLYTPGNLYVGINGTGRLYKIKNQDDALNFIREDSTFYMGDSFNAANFSSGDTIYSFGGYGFWKTNGLFRYYNRVVHEWEVIKTNREIITHTGASYFWVDVQNNRFYLAGQKIVNDGLKPQPISSKLKNNNIFTLDLTKGEWTELGVLKDYPEKSQVNSPWGPLFILTFNSYINDFIQNRKLIAKKPVIEKFKKVFAGFSPDVVYFVDSTFYFGNVTFNSFDSIQLSINDFEYKGEAAYTPLTTQINFTGNKYNKLLWLATIPFVLLLLFMLYKNKKRKKIKLNELAKIQNNHYDLVAPEMKQAGFQKFNDKNENQSQVFSELEKELIFFIYKKTAQEYTVNVEEINNVLGLSGKNESVQKKNRSETINDINQKWSVLYGNDRPLIDRQRSEFDKRSFEYFIPLVWFDSVTELSTTFKANNKQGKRIKNIRLSPSVD